jgi:glycosyltransferase involved in cell wall biosynthesis
MEKLLGRCHLLFICHESWPTFRPDVAVLFGKYLPRFGVTCDIVTETDATTTTTTTTTASPAVWEAGRTILCRASASRGRQYLIKTMHNLWVLARCDPKKYDAIQVRDMPVAAFFGIVVAAVKRLPFFYWMSFPQSEGQIARARARGPAAGLRYWFPLIQGLIGQWLLYKIVLPRATHVFAQSEQMLRDLSAKGLSLEKMSAVPMGVDLERAAPESIAPSDDVRLAGKRVLIHLGSLDRNRKIEMLFEMVKLVHQQEKNVLLVLAGGVDDVEHSRWLRQEADRLGVADLVVWTGWLPVASAWRYLRAAEIGLSPIPRGVLLDCASPTKLIEYLAFGLPAIVNDNPDQRQVVLEGECGTCVPWQAAAFSDAALAMLADPARRQSMGSKGRAFVSRHRGYDSIARALAETYARLLR